MSPVAETLELDTEPAVGLLDNGRSMTPEEFDAITNWDEFYRYELVRGVLIVVPPAGAGERSPNDKLGFLFLTYRAANPHGKILDDTLPEQTVKTGENRRRADRVVWIGLGRTPRPGRDVPAIVIEFVSRSSRDRRRDYIEKRQEYAAIGVAEYWVIDRYRRKMTAYRTNGEIVAVAASESYRTPLLPDFELPFGQLLSAADLYPDSDESTE